MLISVSHPLISTVTLRGPRLSTPNYLPEVSTSPRSGTTAMAISRWVTSTTLILFEFRLTGQAAITNDTAGICSPDSAIEYDEQIDTALEFQKPLGTGTDIWPSTPTAYAWSLACTKLDDLSLWWTIPSNRDTFAHVTHTFTHEGLNNATYADTSREVMTPSSYHFIKRLIVLYRSHSTRHGWPRSVSTKLSASQELVSSHREYLYIAYSVIEKLTKATVRSLVCTTVMLSRHS